MCFRDSRQQVGIEEPTVSPVQLRELRVPIEKKQMRVEQFAVAAKRPHKDLHGHDVEQQASVREDRSHLLNQYRTLAEEGALTLADETAAMPLEAPAADPAAASGAPRRSTLPRRHHRARR